MFKMWWSPLLLFSIINFSESARILGFIPTPSYSHQIIYLPIFKELALRGHDVVLCTTNPMKDPNIKNLKEIDLSFSYEKWNKNLPNLINKGMIAFINEAIKVTEEILVDQLEHPEVRNLINNQTEHFDLVMIEYMYLQIFAFKHRFNCPFIGLSSLDASDLGHRAVGNPTHAILYPDSILPFDEGMPFIERVITTGIMIFFKKYYEWFVFSNQNELVEKYFGEGYPDVLDMANYVDMLFINTNPVFTQTRPVTPAMISIGGGIHIKELKPLPKALKEFLDNSKEGVVYFSLGSNVKSKEISAKTRENIMQAFSELPYKVLWKFEDDELPGKPDNVEIMKWVPQQDVLRHPNVKVFITQGGLQSIEEALFSHVPMVGLPYFADQLKNAKMIQKKGIGLTIEDHSKMTSKELKETILEVFNNPKYKNKIKELADLVRDEPMNALEKAVWWTEYVIRHKGAQHLKGPGLDMPFYQYCFFDVIAFYIVLITVLICSIYYSVRFFIRLIKKFCCKLCKSKSKKVKDN